MRSSSLFDTLLEGGGLEGGSGITARLFQFFEDVGYGRQAEGVVDELRGLQRAQHIGVADQGVEVIFCLLRMRRTTG